MTAGPALTFVVPLYNAAGTIRPLVAEIAALAVEGGHELVLVNDGSSDATGDICRSLLSDSEIPVTYVEHTRNFVDAVKSGSRAICDIETSVRSDMLCQLASIALKAGRKLSWDPQAESFGSDAAANSLLNHRPFRGEWKLPGV